MRAGRSADLHELNNATVFGRPAGKALANASDTGGRVRTPIPPQPRSRAEPMQPPPQLVQWLKQSYPKPSVDEVFVSVSTSCSTRVDEVPFTLVRTGFRNATPG